MTNLARLVDQLDKLKWRLGEWRESVPPYYEPFEVLVDFNDLDEVLAFPYPSRLEYSACISSAPMVEYSEGQLLPVIASTYIELE
jgi:hypothetical protein